jgi:hypothetical protein
MTENPGIPTKVSAQINYVTLNKFKQINGGFSIGTKRVLHVVIM